MVTGYPRRIIRVRRKEANTMRFVPVLLVLALIALVPAALASGPAVVMKEFSFVPSTIVLQAGVPTDVTFVNKGVISHSFVMDLPVGDKMKHFEAEVAPGKTVVITLTVAKPGTYELHCGEAGQDAAGMTGTIIV